MERNNKIKSKKKPNNSTADENSNLALQQNSAPHNENESEHRRITDVATNNLLKRAKKSPTTQHLDGTQHFQAVLPPPGNVKLTPWDDWHAGKKEDYATEVKVRTVLSKLECNRTEPSVVLEEDIYWTLKLHDVNDVEALYKTSKQRFVLIFESEDSALKCWSEVLCAVSDNVSVSLLFWGQWRTPTFLTLFCPECISCPAVELAFSKFGEVDKAFCGKDKFKRNIRNGKRHIRIFPSGGDPRVLPRKITFHDEISRDILHKGKIVNHYRCDTWHALGDGCPIAVSEEADVLIPEQEPSPP